MVIHFLYRDEPSISGWQSGLQTVSGKIDSESLAGIRIANRTIPIADVIDVQYDVPGVINFDTPVSGETVFVLK